MSDFSLKAIFGMDATGFKNELKSLGSSVTSFADKWGSIGLAAGAAGFVAVAKGALEAANSIKSMALDVGIGTTSYQALQFAAEEAGVSQDKFDQGLKKVKESVIEAAMGNEKLSEAFGNLGLNAKDLLALPLDQQYQAIAAAVHYAANQANAYNDVVEIFGARVGPGLMASLNALAQEGLPGVTAAAQKAGEVMDEKTIASLSHASSEIDAFKKRITVAIGNILVDFQTGPGLEAIGYTLLEYAAKFGGGIIDAVAQADQIIVAVLGGTFTGIVNNMRNGLLSAADAVAQRMVSDMPTWVNKWASAVESLFGSTAGSFAKLFANKLNLEVSVAPKAIEDLKTTGDGIGASINAAIAKTSPTNFAQTLSDGWRQLAQTAQAAADHLGASQFGKDLADLKNAGQQIAQDIELAADKLADGGKRAAAAIKAVSDGFAAGGRGGAQFNQASDDSLKKTIQDNSEKIHDLMFADNTNPALKLVNQNAIAGLQIENQNAQTQLDTRNKVRNGLTSGGIDGAYNAVPNIDPLQVDKLVQQFATLQTPATKTQTAVEKIQSTLAAVFSPTLG